MESKIFVIVAEADVVIHVALASKALFLRNFLRFIAVCYWVGSIILLSNRIFNKSGSNITCFAHIMLLGDKF